MQVADFIDKVCADLATLLKEKNRKYGNSVIEPKRIFSSVDAIEQIKVRLDDKLSRYISGQADDDEDILLDITGYLIMWKVALAWDEYNETKLTNSERA